MTPITSPNLTILCIYQYSAESLHAYIEDYAYSYNILFDSSLPWREMNIIKNFELQSIDDSINCGCYCAYYFACKCNLLKHIFNQLI